MRGARENAELVSPDDIQTRTKLLLGDYCMLHEWVEKPAAFSLVDKVDRRTGQR